MFFTHTTFIGIDPTAGKKPFTYAALDHNLSLLVLGEGHMDEVLAFAAGQRQAYVAVCGPNQPNRGVMERDEVRRQLSPQPRPGRWRGFRVAEYQLRQHNIPCPKTGSDEKSCPGWMRMGFTLYRRLELMGYCPYPSKDSPRQWLEVYPHASFCALLGKAPLAKHSLEGRIQRQIILYDQNIQIPDPMRVFEEITRNRLRQGTLLLDDLYTAGELDAVVAAYSAWLAAKKPDEITMIGHPEEGQVFLPVKTLKRKY